MSQLLPLALALAGALAPQEDAVEAVRAFHQQNGQAILERYCELLAIPCVSDDLPNLRRNAAKIADGFRELGATMKVVELEVEGASPLVFGRLDAEGATRTLGVYVHYDGQPVDPARWSTPPWEPALYTRAIDAGGVRRALPKPGEAIDPEWRLYARAAGDDKAPLCAWSTAIAALEGAGIARTSNLVFVFEGEEEAGSPHLGEYFRELTEELSVDLWLVCDGPLHQSGKPQLVFGVRGVVGFELTVYGARAGLHSGHYGNWAPNPGLALSRLLASMKDDEGKVLVEGFYDDVVPLGDAERAALARVPAVDEQLKRELGIGATEGGGATLSERLLLPSLNVRGLSSGNVGDKARNVIPPSATASLDIRLVADCEPERMLDLVEAHVRAQGFHIVRDEPTLEERRAHEKLARFVRGRGYRAARTSMEHPLVAPLAAAAERAAGEAPILTPALGGSLPLYLFEDILQAPIVIVPIANHDDNQHAPDENLRLANLWYGIELFAAILRMP